MGSTRFKDMVKQKSLIKEPIDTSSLPTKGGRQSIPEGVTTLGAMLQEMGVLTPGFNIQILGILEKLAMYNPEVSNAVNNIVQLGNTAQPFPSVIFDDDVTPEVRKKALMRLKRKSKSWYSFSGGLMSLVSDLLTQAAIAGCISAESVPEDALDGVKKIVLVSPKNIRFKYDVSNDKYNHYQASNGIGGGVEGLILLNGVTYSYIAVQRMGEKPYAIPPFLAALDNVYIGADMAKDVKNIIKRLGAAGFLEVLLKAPKIDQSEIGKAGAYEARTQKILEKAIPEVAEGMANGFVAGFKDEHEFKLHSTATNLQGAGTLVTANDYKIMRGLKQDPLMFGENVSTTETLARVILAKMTTQIKTYQHIVSTFLEKVFLMDLQLAGYPINHIDVEFEPPMVSDKLKDAQAFEKELMNLKLLYAQGIINQDQFASEAGYETAAEEEPRPMVLAPVAGTDPANPDGESKKTDPAGGDGKADTKKKDETANDKKFKAESGLQVLDLLMQNGEVISDVVFIGGTCISHTKIDLDSIVSFEASCLTLSDLTDVEANSLGVSRKPFEYHTEGCSCDDHSITSFAKDTDFESFLDSYLKDTKNNYNKATKDILGKIAKTITEYKTTVSGSELVDTILYVLYKEWGAAFSEAQKMVISRNIKSAYSFFRKDSSIFGDATGIPKGTFDLVDTRVLDYYKKSDSFYLGKFITDEDLKVRITQYIKDDFLKDRTSIDMGAEELKLLNANLGEVFTGQEWKLKRVILTTLNKMRNTAAVNYMQQAEVESYQVVGVNDRLQCPYCANMQGKVFSVSKMIDNVKQYASSDPNYVGVDAPFVTSVFKSPDLIANLTGEELQAQGIHAPPFHSNCRDTVVAIIN